MEFRSRGGAAEKWRRKFSSRSRISVTHLLFLVIVFFLLSLILRKLFTSNDGAESEKYSSQKFLFYAPHSGFSNQVSELKNAILFAAILNRTLVVPPVLDHHAVALGSCPKFRVSSPSGLRASVWDHSIELLRNRRFVSIAEILDLSSIVSSSALRTIDYREFASGFCGIDWNLLCNLPKQAILPSEFENCRKILSISGPDDLNHVYGVEDDCRTTVWIYNQDNDNMLDAFQPDEEFKRRKNISFIRKRRDIYKALGLGTKAETFDVLAFGSLFSSPYKNSELHIDIHETPRDARVRTLLRKLDYIPFSKEIIAAGKNFARNIIKEPFLCAQLRLLDGQFKNHWKETFSSLSQNLDLLMAHRGSISIFIMTDLPKANWTGTYLSDLSRNSSYFKVITLDEDDMAIEHASKKLIYNAHSPRMNLCAPMKLPSILLYVQEVVCSCASLGFVGTSGSTIAESIEAMRRNSLCSSEPL